MPSDASMKIAEGWIGEADATALAGFLDSMDVDKAFEVYETCRAKHKSGFFYETYKALAFGGVFFGCGLGYIIGTVVARLDAIDYLIGWWLL